MIATLKASSTRPNPYGWLFHNRRALNRYTKEGIDYMNQTEFEQYENEQLLVIADKAKEIEVALRINQDWSDKNNSRLTITKVRDRANEILALYVDIMRAEMEIEEDKPSYDPYEDEDNNNNSGYGSADDFYKM